MISRYPETLKDFNVELAAGNLTKYSVIHKFGTNENVGTSFVPISRGGVYQVPTTATALEVVSSDANDTAAGSGARTVTIIGLDSNWVEVSQTVSMNGTTAVAIPTSLTRVYRATVATSGTYANAAAGSHAGTITVQGAGGGATWLQIYFTDFPRGQSQCGIYTIPSGKTGVVYFHYISVDSNKSADVVFFRRENADTVAAPYSAMKANIELIGLSGIINLLDSASPQGPFVGPCDIGFMGKFGTGTGGISVDYEIVLYNT